MATSRETDQGAGTATGSSTSSEVAGAATFKSSGAEYDSFMGRYSRQLAFDFADFAGIEPGDDVLDVGCGPGALTAVLVDRISAGSVLACDPSGPFVSDCRRRCPDVDVRYGPAEAIPFDDDSVDAVLSQLVLHFVGDPTAALSEMRRVARAGGTIAACVWHFDLGMEMLRHFWDAALDVDAGAPDEARVLRFGRPGEIAELFRSGGCDAIDEKSLTVGTTYTDFDELWAGFLAGIGPAGSYCVSLDDDRRQQLREGFHERCGSPSGSFELEATALAARCVAP